jgi:hypothetical protein
MCRVQRQQGCINPVVKKCKPQGLAVLAHIGTEYKNMANEMESLSGGSKCIFALHKDTRTLKFRGSAGLKVIYGKYIPVF